MTRHPAGPATRSRLAGTCACRPLLSGSLRLAAGRVCRTLQEEVWSGGEQKNKLEEGAKNRDVTAYAVIAVRGNMCGNHLRKKKLTVGAHNPSYYCQNLPYTNSKSFVPKKAGALWKGFTQSILSRLPIPIRAARLYRSAKTLWNSTGAKASSLANEAAQPPRKTAVVRQISTTVRYIRTPYDLSVVENIRH